MSRSSLQSGVQSMNNQTSITFENYQTTDPRFGYPSVLACHFLKDNGCDGSLSGTLTLDGPPGNESTTGIAKAWMFALCLPHPILHKQRKIKCVL